LARYRCCRFDVVCLDHVGGRSGTAVASIDELNDACRRDEPERREIEQSVGGLELAVLDL
jgi:hypothetical protein